MIKCFSADRSGLERCGKLFNFYLCRSEPIVTVWKIIKRFSLQIGADWNKVVQKMCRGHYQPLLLIYQNQEATEIDTSQSIKKSFLLKDFLHSFDKIKTAMVPICKLNSILCVVFIISCVYIRF